MPWEIGKSYIRSGHRPGSYFDSDSFRTIDIDKQAGIKAIVGCKKGNYKSGKCQIGQETKSFLFPIDRFTMKQAKAWFKEHKKKKKEESSAVKIVDIEVIIPKVFIKTKPLKKKKEEEKKIPIKEKESAKEFKLSEPIAGLLLVSPHGKLIWEGKKKAIVKSKKFDEYSNKPIYLIENKLCYGIITLKTPSPIDEECFKKYRKEHMISDKERKEWCKKQKLWCKTPLYYSEIISFKKYDIPKPVRIPKGVQVWVKKENIEFLSVADMTLSELEFLHSYYHSCAELFSPCCKEHFKIANEILDRGYEHLSRDPIDRIVILIKDYQKILDDPKTLESWNKKVIGDDWRILCGWSATLAKGKKFESPQFKDKTLEQQKSIVKRLIKIYRDYMTKHGWKIETKPEEKLWTLPKDMKIEDIDPPYLSGLSDKTIIEIWKYLIKETEKKDRIPENYTNAGVFVGIELKKRHNWEEYKGDYKLTKAIRYRVQEYPIPAMSKEILEPEGEEYTIDQLYNASPPTIVIPGQPYAIYCTGRASNLNKIPKDHDWDWDLKQKPDPRVIEAIKRIKPEWLSNLIHPFFDPSGPLIGMSYPLYRYGFFKVPKNEFIRGFGPFRQIEKELSKEIKPFQKFRALKAKSGWGKNEFWKYREFYTVWISKYLDKGITIQKKYDGRRFSLHKLGDKVQIITEDKMRDRSKELPNVVKELLSIKHDFIFDAEAVGYDCKNKKIKSANLKEKTCEEMPREDTAYLSEDELTVGGISEIQEDSVVFYIHDLLFLDDKSLNNEVYSVRFNKLKSILPKNLQFLNVVASSPVLKTPGQIKIWTQRLRTTKGSEGVMAKAEDIYPIKIGAENRTDTWAKLKNLKSIEVMVWSATPKRKRTGEKLPTWMYDSYILIPKEEVKHWRKNDIVEWKGKNYCRIGKTYGRKLKPKRGDIIEVLVGRIREYVKNGVHWISWMFPNFRELKPEKKEPDTLDTARKLAKVGPGFIERLFEKVITLRLKECPFVEVESICPLRYFWSRPRKTLSELSMIKIEYLKFPIICPLSNLYKCPRVKPYYYGFKTLKRRKLE